MSSAFRAERVSKAFCGHDVLILRRELPDSPLKPEIRQVTVAEAAGAAPIEMLVRLPGGREFNMLGTRGPRELQDLFYARKRRDPYATNLFFQPGIAAPLWPIANRLTGREVEMDVIEARVLGMDVRMPLNHGRATHQRRHHLHGFAFHTAVAESLLDMSDHEARAESRLRPDAHDGMWIGRAEVAVEQKLTAQGFEFRFTARNTSDTPMPAGGGAHPYFQAPGADPAAVKLWIPGRRTVEIDSYENVLPTGRLLPVPERSEYDFHTPGGVVLSGKYLDNLWIDLEPDEQGFAFAEFADLKAGYRARMTATTKNVIGVQAYAPGASAAPDLGIFAALELVTNLPDPREALWGDTPTGMRLLAPGESFTYGYRIELADAD